VASIHYPWIALFTPKFFGSWISFTLKNEYEYVHVVSLFPPAHHYRAVLAWVLRLFSFEVSGPEGEIGQDFNKITIY
jgi:hypothetical protein